MIKVVIFDLDDTLISEREYIKSGFKEVAKKIKTIYKLNINKEEIFNNLEKEFEKDSREVFNRVLNNFNIEYTKDDILYLIKIYREHKPDIKFYNDVMPAIKELKQNKIKVGIISDGYLATQKAKLEAINAYSIFDKIILTEEIGRNYWKPHPKAFEMMKKYFSVDYDEIMYIGDNPKKDFYIGKEYPVYTVRLIRDNGIYMDEIYYKNIEPKKTVDCIYKIIEIINYMKL